jgi:hypothetical protein
VEINGIYFGRECGSRLAVNGGMLPGLVRCFGCIWGADTDKMPMLLQGHDEVSISLGIHITLRRSYYSATIAKST